jgi:hypothetical protein
VIIYSLVLEGWAGYWSPGVEADVWPACDERIGCESPIFLGVEDNHGFITENGVSTKGNVPVGFDFHAQSDFAFVELSLFIDEAKEDDFGIESLTGCDDETLEAVDLGAACGGYGGRIFLVWFEDVVVLSQRLQKSV